MPLDKVFDLDSGIVFGVASFKMSLQIVRSLDDGFGDSAFEKGHDVFAFHVSDNVDLVLWRVAAALAKVSRQILIDFDQLVDIWFWVSGSGGNVVVGGERI